MSYTRKRANPRKIIAGFQKVFKHVKIYSVITIIKKIIDAWWTKEELLLFTKQTCLKNLHFFTT